MVSPPAAAQMQTAVAQAAAVSRGNLAVGVGVQGHHDGTGIPRSWWVSRCQRSCGWVGTACWVSPQWWLCDCRGWCREELSVMPGSLLHLILCLRGCYGLWGGCPGVPAASGILAKASYPSPCLITLPSPGTEADSPCSAAKHSGAAQRHHPSKCNNWSSK